MMLAEREETDGVRGRERGGEEDHDHVEQAGGAINSWHTQNINLDLKNTLLEKKSPLSPTMTSLLLIPAVK